MKHLKSIALGALISLSFAPMAYSMKTPDSKTFKTLADIFKKLSFIQKIEFKKAIDACAEVEWSKLFELISGK